jgi:hypothetical protein
MSYLAYLVPACLSYGFRSCGVKKEKSSHGEEGFVGELFG